MTRRRVVVYTAIAGGGDELREPEFVSDRCDHVCFTDNPFLASRHWQTRPFDETFADPVRTAKKPKVLPHRYLEDYEASVWIDGNMTIVGDLAELVDRHLADAPLAMFVHPEGRASIFDEADECVKRHKDDPQVIARQMAEYREAGFSQPPGPIPACTVIIRRHRHPRVVETMETWWQEIVRHSRRDQLSFGYVASRIGLAPAIVHDDVRHNEWLDWRPHDAASRLDALRRRTENAGALLLSVPKAGRTWLRYFLGKYVERAFGEPFSLDIQGVPGFPVVVFSHSSLDAFQDGPGPHDVLFQDVLAAKPLVVLVRDPRDVAVSYFHQKRSREGLAIPGLREFVLSDVYGIERQSRFQLALLDALDRHPGDHLLMRYERVLENPQRQLRRLVAFLAGEVDEQALEAAVAASTFEAMREHEAELNLSGRTGQVFNRLGLPGWDGDRDAQKVRRGIADSHREEMDDALLALIDELPQTRRLLARLS